VAGQWQIGDPPVLVVVDASYDVIRLAFLLADLPVELLGRMRSDRVLYFPPAPQPTGKRGRKPKRGAEFAFEVAAGFRRLHGKTPQPADAPKPSTAGPGRPTGMKNKHRAREHPVGKQDKPNLAAAITSSKAA